MKNKTLYVSDLDGTLLRSNQTTSEYTNEVINSLTEKGIVFSYATARSIYTSSKVTKGLDAKIPVITYNGAFIVDNCTHEVLHATYFDRNVYNLLRELFSEGVYPIVYSIVGGKERFSYYTSKSSKTILGFAASRNDERKRNVDSEEELVAGNIFYITCIETPEKIKPFYDKIKTYIIVFIRGIFILMSNGLKLCQKMLQRQALLKNLNRLPKAITLWYLVTE